MHVTFLLQGMWDREAVIGWPGPAEVEKGWVNGPSAFLNLRPVHHKSTNLP